MNEDTDIKKMLSPNINFEHQKRSTEEVQEQICDCEIHNDEIKQHEDDIKHELRTRELSDVNGYK